MHISLNYEQQAIKWITLALSESKSLPMVDNNLHMHSKLSSSPAQNSLNKHSCIIVSVNN